MPSGNPFIENHALVAGLFRDLPEAVFVVDRDRRIWEVNPATARVFGYAESELVGRSTRLLYDDEAGYAAIGRARQALADNPNPGAGPSSDSRFRVTCRRRSGETFPAEVFGAPLRDERGSVVGYIGIYRDVGEQFRVEESLQTLYAISTDQTLDGRAKIQAILELGARRFGLPLGIVSRIEGERYSVEQAVSPNGEIEPGASFPLGRTYCVHTLAADGPTAFHEAGRSEIAAHPCYRDFRLESYIGAPLTVDGERWGTLNYSGPEPRGAAFGTADLELIRLFAQWIANELSAVRRLEQLNQARAEAEAANTTKSRFLATMSHELRTPMTGVLGLLDLLEMTGLDGERADYVRQAKLCARNLTVLLDDILDLSKIEAGQLRLERIPAEIEGLARSVVETFRPVAASKGLVLGCEVDPRLPALACDPTRLRQVLTNLVSNAVKFTESGCVRLSVRQLGSADAALSLRFEVSDSGPGVAPDRQESIFEAFAQGDASTTRRYGGTGLGLAICRRLVETMGGELTLESRPGEGARFGFTLRLDAVESGAAQPAAARPVSGCAPARPLRILVAEDNAVNAMLLQSMLERSGHRVALVGNGAEAVEAAAAETFDVAVMDMQMPVMDGVEATRRIRALGGAAAGLPIVALSADAVVENRRLYEGVGLDAFLTKPVDWEVLGEALLRAAAARPAALRAVEQAGPELLDGALLDGALLDGALLDGALLDDLRLDDLTAGLGEAATGRVLAAFRSTVTETLGRLGEALSLGVSAPASRLLAGLAQEADGLGAQRLAAAAAELCAELEHGVPENWPDRLAALEALGGATLTALDARSPVPASG